MQVKGIPGADVVVPRRLVGPTDFYSRATVGTSGEEVRAFNYGLGNTIPGTSSVATLRDTNMPRDLAIYDHFEMTEMSWHLLVPHVSGATMVVKRLLDQTIWEFYLGGEKPYFQSLMLVTAISFGMSEFGARSMPIVLPQELPLHRLLDRGKDRFYMRLLPPKLDMPIEVVFRIGCRHVRGVC